MEGPRSASRKDLLPQPSASGMTEHDRDTTFEAFLYHGRHSDGKILALENSARLTKALWGLSHSLISNPPPVLFLFFPLLKCDF